MATYYNVPSPPPAKAAYSVEEVAELLGIHRVTVSHLINRGELRAARLGHRTVRVTHQALMEFLRKKEEEAAQEIAERKSRGKTNGAKAKSK
jgi:excisionase family DNA binding protein